MSLSNYLKKYFRGLLKELIKNCDGELKTEVVSMAATYEHRLTKGNKSIYHLEAFVAKFMSVYLHFVEETMGGFLKQLKYTHYMS